MLDERCSPAAAAAIAQAVHAGEAAVPPWERDGAGGTATGQRGVVPPIPGILAPRRTAGSGRTATQRQADVCRRAALSRRLWESLAPTLANEGLLNALHTVSVQREVRRMAGAALKSCHL